MSKEMTPLEALEKLFDTIVDEYSGCEIMGEFQKDKNIIETALKALEIIKECCEFDFIKKEENDKPIRYEIHIRRKGGDNIFFPCLAIYPKNQEEVDLLKEVLL